MRPQWGAFGRAKQALSACFVNPLAIEPTSPARLDLAKTMLPAQGTRKLTSSTCCTTTPARTLPRQSADLRRVCRRRACDLRAGARAAAGAALHAAMSTARRTLPGAARVGIGGPVGSGKTALVER